MMIRSHLPLAHSGLRSATPQSTDPAPAQAPPQDSAAIGEYKPGELILRTRPGFELSGESGSVVDQLGAKVIGEFDTPGGVHKSETGEFMHLKLPEGVSVEQAMAKLADDPRVEFSAPNHIYRLDAFEQGQNPMAVNDPDASKLWGLHNEGQTGGKVDADIDAPEAWQIHSGRNQAQGGPLIAVIDTGIDYNHPDLKANMWVNPGEIPGDGIDNDGNGVIDDVHGYNAYSDNGDPMDGQGHGTHCAGTIAAVGNNGIGVVGVNQNASVMAVKIFNDEGSTDSAAIIRGVQYATKMGARITSNSWGGPVPNSGIREAFEQSSSALHLVAAGNSGYNNDWLPSFPANYGLDNLVAVAATDHNDGLASFSQYGKRNVDLGAPGVDILSTVPGGGYATYSGTSMATPHVSGAAALVASHYPDISNEDLRRRLEEGTDKVESLDGKTASGGRLNVHQALTMELS
ncbi:MAG: S8 family peptidase [Vulcanimicrobiota bacterium]